MSLPICRFVDGIEGTTILDLNDEVNYWFCDPSEFPLPEVIYNWVEGTGHGQKLASWKLGGGKITLALSIKGTDSQDAYDKLNVLLTRLLLENTLEVKLWGDYSLFYHTYPALPKMPDEYYVRHFVEAGWLANFTVEIPVDPLVHTSEETLWLVHALGTNDDFETHTGDNFDDWEELEIDAGTVTADAVNYHSGSVACKLTTTAGGTDSAAVRSPYTSVDELETHGLRVWAKELSGAPALDVDVHCYDDTTSLITKLTNPYEVDTLLLDGTAAINELITSTAMTMAGVPTTGALLGATAPNIGAATYTSCTIPTATIGLASGGDITFVIAFKPTWAGDDGALHYLLDTYTAGAGNGIRIRKGGSNLLGVYTYSNTAAKATYGAVDGVNLAANVTHILVVRLTAANVQSVWLDGVALTSVSGAAAREVAHNATTYVGTDNAGVNRVEGLELCAIINRAVTDDEVAALSALTDWADLTDITISGLSTGNAARAYSGATIMDSAVEAAGAITLTPEGANRSIRVYEDNSYADLIATYSPTIWG
ncbi:MAG: hypothetical protein WC977_11330, partial [Anaerovoracaceae bacterium]